MKRRVLLFALMLTALGCLSSCATATEVPYPPTASAAEPTAAPTDVAAVSPGDSLAVISLVIEPAVVAVGETTEAVVSVSDVADLYGVELHLRFDPALLEIVDASGETEEAKVIDGELLKVGFTAINAVDGDAGTLDYAVSQMPPSEGVSGAGVVARVLVRAKAAGITELTIEGILLASADGVSIPLVIDVTSASVDIK